MTLLYLEQNSSENNFITTIQSALQNTDVTYQTEGACVQAYRDDRALRLLNDALLINTPWMCMEGVGNTNTWSNDIP